MNNLFGPNDIYVSPGGDDKWRGRLAEPNAEGTEGPVATVERARRLVQELKTTCRLKGPVTVWLRGGRYFLNRTLTFTPDDSAAVTYAAYPGEQPIISGGVKIGGWRQEQVLGRTMWTADVSELLAKKGFFRQLFVGNQRRQRARLPKEGCYRMESVPGTPFDAHYKAGADAFVSASGEFGAFKNVSDVDIVVLHWWIEERLPVVSFDSASRLVRLARKSNYALLDDIGGKYAKYYIEHVFEALSEPGEWYLDRPAGKLYYIPMPGESIDAMEAFAPHLTEIMKLQGQPDQGRYVEFIRFQGLTFEHSRQTERYEARQGAGNVPGTIVWEGVRNCAMEDCVIRHVGLYALELRDGCTANRIVGNEITDIGAGGVKIDGADAYGPLCRRTGNNRVTDNRIYACGRVHQSATGVMMMNTFGNYVAHNHIHDLFYSGIACGWVWGYGQSVAKNNRIEKNHIHDLGQGVLSDMGGIYTLGDQPGTLIRGNLIHDIRKANYGGWAIYPDEGSSHMLIENNVCYNTSSQPFHLHFGRENILRNNIWAFGDEGMIAISRGERLYWPEKGAFDDGSNPCSFTFERNIVIADGQAMFVGGMDDETGNVQTGSFISDLNVFWDVSGKDIFFANGGHKLAHEGYREKFTWQQWRQMGYDHHSVVADPRCRDLANRDFTLLPDSPALELGFKPIDLSDVGPRPADKRD